MNPALSAGEIERESLVSRLTAAPLKSTSSGTRLLPKGMMISQSAPALKTAATSRVDLLRSITKLNSNTVLMGSLEATIKENVQTQKSEASNYYSMGQSSNPEFDMSMTNTMANSMVPKKHTTFMESLNLSVKERYELLHIAQSFFYLRICPVEKQASQGIPNSVYDLEKVSQDDTDKNFYFTLSKEGITQYRNKVSTFTTIAQWEREFKLYHQISQIKFFKQYKRWKV